MFRCDRCGAGFGPIQAAVLEFCPRCRARDQVLVALVTRIVKDPPTRVSGDERAGVSDNCR